MASRRLAPTHLARHLRSSLGGRSELSSAKAASSGSTFSTAAAAPKEAHKGSQPIWATPLSEALPSVEEKRSGRRGGAQDPFRTQLSRLESGLRVATEPGFGDFATVGVFAEAGCRYQIGYPTGITHFLEKLAFQSTAKFASREEVFAELESSSAICDALSQRHTFALASTCHAEQVPKVLSVIADSALRPRITEAEFAGARQAIQWELEGLENNPDRASILQDLIHAAAFRGNTLGLPKLCPEENLSLITRPMLYAFLARHFVPERMVIGGVGVEHDVLVDAARRYFQDTPPIWETDPQGCLEGLSPPQVDTSTAQYTGGCVQVNKDLSVFDFGPSPFPNLAHVQIGLEGASFLSSDYVPLALLQSLFGGGDSFSAGGPGKGLYTRLYTQALNVHHFLYSCQAFNLSYKDGGVFYIQASCNPLKLGEAARVVVRQFLSLQSPPEEAELSRAKNQLKASIMMNLETRPARFEDMVEMVIGREERKTPEAFAEEIDAVTPERMAEVCARMLSSKVSLVGYGDLTELPTLQAVEEAFAARSLQPLLSLNKRNNKGLIDRIRGV